MLKLVVTISTVLTLFRMRWFTLKTHEDQLDALMARLEKRLTSFEVSVSHMKGKLSELHEMQENLSSPTYNDSYNRAV